MQEKLDALVRTQAMQLFRQQRLHFTMQQVAEPLHISKKTIYTVYLFPSPNSNYKNKQHHSVSSSVTPLLLYAVLPYL